MTIGPFTFTRDSALWWWGIVCAVIVGVATNLDLFPWLSERAQHVISLASFVIGIISGKMATSPLPSKADADTVTRPPQ